MIFFLLRAGTKYSVNVTGLFDGGMSMPLAGEEKTTLSDGPDIPFYTPGAAPCYPAHTHTDSSRAHDGISSAKFMHIL